MIFSVRHRSNGLVLSQWISNEFDGIDALKAWFATAISERQSVRPYIRPRNERNIYAIDYYDSTQEYSVRSSVGAIAQRRHRRSSKRTNALKADERLAFDCERKHCLKVEKLFNY